MIKCNSISGFLYLIAFRTNNYAHCFGTCTQGVLEERIKSLICLICIAYQLKDSYITSTQDTLYSFFQPSSYYRSTVSFRVMHTDSIQDIYPYCKSNTVHSLRTSTHFQPHRNVVVSFSDLVQLRFRRYRIFFGALEFRDPSAPSFLLRDRVAEGEGFFDILVRD